MINTQNFTGVVTPAILDAIVRVESPDANPLLAMLLGAGRTLGAPQTRVEWKTVSPSARRTQINNGGTAYNAATTSIVVDDGSLFLGGDMVICEATGEVIRVSAVSGNTLTIGRSVGSQAAAIGSVANNAYLMNIGNASGEGSGSPANSSASRVTVHNFLQTFRRGVEITGRMQRTKTITPNELAFQREEAFKEISNDMEYALIYGARSENAGNDAEGNPTSTMGGLREAITTHVDNIGGELSLAEFHAFSEMAFDTGSRNKALLAGPTLLTAVHNLYSANQRISSTVTNVGLRIQSVETPHGRFDLIPHPLLRGGFAGEGIAVDVSNLKLRQSEEDKGGKLQLIEGTQAKGKDSTKDEFFAEHTLDWGGEQNHARITGVTLS